MISKPAPLQSAFTGRLYRDRSRQHLRSSHARPARTQESGIFPRISAAGKTGRAAGRTGSVVEAETAQLLRVPLPVFGDLDSQIEVHPGAQERLDLVPGPGPDLPE